VAGHPVRRPDAELGHDVADGRRVAAVLDLPDDEVEDRPLAAGHEGVVMVGVSALLARSADILAAVELKAHYGQLAIYVRYPPGQGEVL
jgi:hypothetical protein